MDNTQHSLSERAERLYQFLKNLPHPAAIAFSGGVDSTFLLSCAVRHCRYPVYALYAASPFVHSDDRLRIPRLAHSLGALIIEVEWNPFDHPEIIRNDRQRCYFCKSAMYTRLSQHAFKADAGIVMDGTQADDISSDRPGLRAISELEIITPLAQFGLDKHDVRHLSYLQTLETWELASQSCLATRIETGRRITQEELLLVDKIEAMLAEKGIMGSRFRLGNGKARVFIPDCGRIELEALLQSIHAVIEDSGFGSLELVPELGK